MLVGARTGAWSGGAKLPYKRRLAYLQGTGEQFIDANIVVVPSLLKMELRCSMVAKQAKLVGGRNGSSNDATCAHILTSSGGIRVDWPASSGSTSLSLSETMNDIVVYGNNISINGSLQTYSKQKSNLPQNYRFLIFDVDSGPSAYSRYNGMIEYVNLYEDGENATRKMIPVMDLNNEPCFYDEISGELFYNMGTGNFLYGELE